MRVTFDSNAWERLVTLKHTESSPDEVFTTVYEALRTGQIQGFICETVGTLEAVRRAGRKAYFTSIKPTVEVNVDVRGGQALLLTVNIRTNHNQHPGLPKVLKDRLDLAFALGMRLMRAPRIGVPVPASFLDLSVFADEVAVLTSAASDNRWGDVIETIEQRGVGPARLRSLAAETGWKPEPIKEQEFASAVAEWADGDSVAAHIAYGNDVFCTEDRGKSAGGRSILDPDNRQWLAVTHNVKFATIRELATQIRSTRT